MLQRLVIKGPITTLNEYILRERSNKFAAASLKKKETNRVATECIVQKIKPVEKIVNITFTYAHSKRLDFDNVEFYQKFIWDGLKTAGIIKDDTYAYTPEQRLHIHQLSNDPCITVDFFD